MKFLNYSIRPTWRAYVNGREWRWDFHPYLGPYFLKKNGEERVRQPGENHPVWDHFNRWLELYNDSEIERTPNPPARDEWGELFQMLCGYCAYAGGCNHIEHMLEYMAGEREVYPTDAFAEDPGSGTTCLSFKPIAREPDIVEPKVVAKRCSGCAFTAGTDASKSHHTQLECKAAVKHGFTFNCHMQEGACAGWANARKQEVSPK